MNNLNELNLVPQSGGEFKINAKAIAWCMPLYVLIPLGFAFIFAAAGTAFNWAAFGLGAAGWVIAYILRGPLAVIAVKKPKIGKPLLQASSGPLEEGVRVVLLLLTSMQAGWAASIGQGWAAVEVVFVMIQVLAIASLSKRTDEKAIQAKAMLEAQGVSEAHPLWGVLERVFASSYHIGATLCIAAVPWTVWVLIPVHTGFNLTMVKVFKSSVVKAEALAMAVGSLVLAIGIYLMWG